VVLVWFKPCLKNQLVSFSALTLLDWSYGVHEMTYNVLSGTLSLYTSTVVKWRTDMLTSRSCSTLGPVSTGMGDRLWEAKPPRYITSHTNQPSLVIPTVGRHECHWKLRSRPKQAPHITRYTSPCRGPSYRRSRNVFSDHRRRSDWNYGGTHDGTYYKSPAVEAKNTFSYIVMQVI